MKRGLVIGKFYPPHAGHKFLIEYSKANVDQLTVVVCDDPRQKISAETRATWLREMVSDVEVRCVPDCVPSDDSRGWALYTLNFLGFRPDVVFTSEAYGEAYARYLGSSHVCVDRDRKKVPISATQIRKDPHKFWSFLDPCVRAYFAIRVCILGAESTGTTTMARALAQQYKTAWVPEIGRVYSEANQYNVLDPRWKIEDFAFIADAQNRLEDQLARSCNHLLFCDTNAAATELWQKRYVGHTSESVTRLAQGRDYNHYFLTDIDIPFVQDGLRDGKHIRSQMHQWFVLLLKEKKFSYTLLSGTHKQRLAKAVSVCDQILLNPQKLTDEKEA